MPNSWTKVLRGFLLAIHSNLYSFAKTLSKNREFYAHSKFFAGDSENVQEKS
jgi:hypothetical protein